MNSKDLGNCWSAEFHNWQYQSKILMKYLLVCIPQNIPGILETIIKTKRLKLTDNHVVKFHDGFIEYLQKILM